MPLGGQPILAHALRGVLGCAEVDAIVVVAPVGCLAEVARVTAAVVARERQPGPLVDVVAGGDERSHSVQRGLAALPEHTPDGAVDVVLVHDAARALTPSAVFDRVIEAVREGHSAVVPAMPVVDTIKTVRPQPAPAPEPVVATLDRLSLRAVQTPQGFARETLRAAHAGAAAVATDDAGLVEASGGTVHTVLGDARSLKITTPHDLDLASSCLPASPPVLVLLGGPPGVGKTAVARALVRRRRAAHLRIDTVEQAILRSRGVAGPLGPEGYAVAAATAADLLGSGLDVVADATHLVAASRAAWRSAARHTGSRVVQVQLSCGDEGEHRRRVQERTADIEGHRLPTWESVARVVTDPWPEADLQLDTAALSVEATVSLIEEAIG